MSFAKHRSCSSLVLAAAIALGGTSVVRADSVHDQAQQSAVQAQANLDAAKKQADQLLAVAGSASAAANRLSTEYQSEQHQAQEIRQRMTRGKAAFPDIQAHIDSATKTLTARQQEMAAEDVHYGPLKVADDKARLDAIGQFENSTEYRTALQTVTDLAAALQTIQGQSVRNGHQPASDPNVLIAQNRLLAAKAAVDALRSKFMQEQLPQIPQVAAADQALAAEQGRYDSLAALASTAQRELDDAKAQIDRQNAGLAGDQTTLDQLSAEITKTLTDLAAAQAATTQTSDDAGRAIATMNSARESRDNAVAAVQQLDDQPTYVSPPNSYAYPPPPIVYAQPGDIYAPGPYYGNILIVPGYRGGYGGYGGGRGYQGHGYPQGHAYVGHGNSSQGQGGHR